MPLWVKLWESLLLTQKVIPLLIHCLQALHKVKSIPDMAVGVLWAFIEG